MAKYEIDFDHLTEDQLKDFREGFEFLERESEGKMTIKELGIVMRSFGQNPTESELKTMIGRVDKDQDGNIDFPEFINILTEQMNKLEGVDQLEKAFSAFDKSGSGFIETADLKNAMMTLGEKMNEKQVQELISAADPKGTGKIDYRDFAAKLAGKPDKSEE